MIPNATKGYTFRSVGVKRHPELYIKESLIEPVFLDVQTELEMWKTAEEIVTLLKRKKFTIPQAFSIWHFANSLLGLNDTLEELKWIEWLKFRITLARTLDVLNSNELLTKIYLGNMEKEKTK